MPNFDRNMERKQRTNPKSWYSTSSSHSSSQRAPSRSHILPQSSTEVKKSAGSHSSCSVLNSRGGEEEDITSLQPLVGTCPFMCPAGERAQRERLRDLAVFERLNGNPRETSASLAVKKFCRTISAKDVKESDFRPLPVLEETLNYLLNLLECREHPFEVVHDFIFDRTRSIRQDLSMQNLINDQVIHMYERMVKFHVISHHKLRTCEAGPNISSLYHLNMEQLTKALTSLYSLYDTNRDPNATHENEAEFRSFYVLLHLGFDSQPTGESLSLWFRHVPASIIKSNEMYFARKILRFARIGNFRSFFSIIGAEASFLQYCIVEPHIDEVRAQALSYVNYAGYKLHPYPLLHLSKLLMMKESDLQSLCNACGLEIYTDESGNIFLPTKQTSFCRPKGGFRNYSFLGLDQLKKPTKI